MRSLRSFYITIWCFLIASVVEAQARGYNKDYVAVDKLTQEFKTYSVHLITKDTTARFPNGEEGELIRAFKFLKGKKSVYKKPDFTFNVIVDDIIHEYPNISVEQIPYRISSTESGVRDRYKVFSNYSLSIRLQVLTANGAEYNIPLATKKLHQKVFYIDNQSPYYNMGTTTPNINNITERYHKNFTTNILNFIKDFNAALLDYR